MKTILIALLLSVSLPSSGSEDPNAYEKEVIIQELCATEGNMGELAAQMRDEGKPKSILLDVLKNRRSEIGEETFRRFTEMVTNAYSNKLSTTYYKNLYRARCLDRYRGKREMI